MAKHLTAQEVYNFLETLKKQGNNLEKISINFRTDYNSDVQQIEEIEEDLFDSETNNILESIVFVADTTDV
jgi:hypothetical protein